jgi:membrane associated rhomboid family serine protease
MDPRTSPSYEVVFDTRRAEIGAAVERALRDAQIPFQSGVQSAPDPRMVFSVPRERLAEAQDVVARCLSASAGAPAQATDSTAHAGNGRFRPSSSSRIRIQDDEDEDEDDELEDPEESEAERAAATAVPWKTVGRWSLLVLFHLVVLASFGGERPATSSLVKFGALVNGRVLTEPWRLVTSLFLHVDPPHVLWNGLSMIVFVVPLVARFGGFTTLAVYLASGVGGGLLAGATGDPSTVTVGSSGAVAGLVGASLVTALQRVWRRRPGFSRARLRVVGIGLLVLPSLLTPTTPAGDRISVASHVGGALAGIVIALLLEQRRRTTEIPPTPPQEEATVH